MKYAASLSTSSRSNERSERKLRSPSTPSKGLLLFSGDISLPFSEVTGVLFKMTSPKGSHPGYAVVIFSRVCTTRTPRRMYRCEQERVYQTLEDKSTSTERHRCLLEKNGGDRRAVPFLRSGSPGLVISRGYGRGMPTPSLFPSVTLVARGSPSRNPMK
jgi:hypothetical protein